MNTLTVGDAVTEIRKIPAQSIQCCVTSPPYFGLRDYRTAQWNGGDPECDHSYFRGGNGLASAKQVTSSGTQKYQYSGECPKCGAVRIDRQLGLEPTLAEYIANMVDVFRDVRRVLRDDGTLWLNIGDSYNAGRDGGWAGGKCGLSRPEIAPQRSGANVPGLKPKDLMMVPARLAIALQDDGWYLRSDIIWHKPNPMPESVTDRPTSAHEHIFLLSKSRRYYYDADAIREPSEMRPQQRFTDGRGDKDEGYAVHRKAPGMTEPDGRNCRNVWKIATKPYKEAHFATFPPELPRRCIKAGTSEKGACAACGAPWVRDLSLSGGRDWHNDTMKAKGIAGEILGEGGNKRG